MQIRERIRMKKLFIGLGIFIVAVAIILVIAVKVFVDEKVIKENIVTQVNNTTQHTMAIDGELTLNFYPKIGFSISDVSFYNKPEFSDEKMFALKYVSVAIDVMSLFSDTIVVDQVSVDGLLANVETLKDERNNIQALLDNVSPAKESISTEDVGAIKVNKAGEVEENKYQIIIGDILIHDANVTLKNQIDNSFHQLSNVNLNVSEFSFDSPVSVALDAKYISNELAVKLDLTTMLLVDKAIKHIALTRFNNQIELKGAGLPKPKINVSIASDIRFDAEYKLVNIDNLKLAVDEITVEGNLSADVFAKPQLKYELSVNAVNVNDWLPKAGSDADDHTAKSNSETKSASAKVESEVEPDLSALSAFNQKGTLTIEKVLFDAYEVDNILINSELSQGIFNLYKLKADLYEGDITIKARLNSTETPAMFSVNSRVNQVQSEQLVTIASGKKLITGFVDSAIQIKGQGLTQTKLKSKTTGTIHTSFSNGDVLMLGYMNQDALIETQASGKVTLYSRTKQRLWTKGESSQNFLLVHEISKDCDNDALLITAKPCGPTCHRGTVSCFDTEHKPALNFIGQLDKLLEERKTADPEESYTASLFARGTKRCAQKVGEEGVEVALAAVAKDRAELVNESADLLYHLLVLLQKEEVPLTEIVQCLESRHK